MINRFCPDDGVQLEEKDNTLVCAVCGYEEINEQ